jgi:hypothetical protein
VGLAVANLTTQATAEGLVIHQMAGILPDQARAEYGIPDNWDPLTAIALGYPGDPDALPDELRKREHAARSRKPLSAFIYAGHWGSAAPLLNRSNRETV